MEKLNIKDSFKWKLLEFSFCLGSSLKGKGIYWGISIEEFHKKQVEKLKENSWESLPRICEKHTHNYFPKQRNILKNLYLILQDSLEQWFTLIKKTIFQIVRILSQSTTWTIKIMNRIS